MGDLSTIEGESKKSHKSHKKEKLKSSSDKDSLEEKNKDSNKTEVATIEQPSQENDRKKSAKKVSFSQLTETEDPQFAFTIEPYTDAGSDKKYIVEEINIGNNKNKNISSKKNSKNKKNQENSPYLSHLKKPSKTKGVKFLKLKKASSSTRTVYESSNFDIFAFDISSTDV